MSRRQTVIDVLTEALFQLWLEEGRDPIKQDKAQAQSAPETPEILGETGDESQH